MIDRYWNDWKVVNKIRVQNNMQAECIQQDDAKSHVLHRVTSTIDGKDYQLVFNAQCPVTAMEIAREVPLAYWEEMR